MSLTLNWAPIDGALLTVGSRQSAINTLWRMTPNDQRTPARRKLTIALIDFMREHYELTGELAPGVPSARATQQIVEAAVLGDLPSRKGSDHA